MRVKGLFKFIFVFVLFTTIVVVSAIWFYLRGLPKLVKNQKVVNYFEKILSEALSADVNIENPNLETSWSPIILVKANDFTIKNKDKILINVKNPDIDISLATIFSKNIVIRKINAEYVYANLSDFLNLPPFKNTKAEKNAWNTEIFKSVIDIKKADIFYEIDKENSVKLNANNIIVSENDKKKNVSYDLKMDLCRQKKYCVDISAFEKGDNTYILDKKHLVIENSMLKVNDANILLNGKVDFNGDYSVNLKGSKFSVSDTMKILASQVVANNFEDYFVYFKDIDGNYNFDVNVSNEGIDGIVKLNKLYFKLIPLENIPILLTQGDVNFDNNKITLKNFKGFYNNLKENSMDFEGTVSDYLKSVDTDLVGNAVVTNDFAKNYLSKFVSYPVSIKGKADTRVMLKSKYNKIDLTWLYMFKKGTGFIANGEESQFNDLGDRVLVAKMGIDGLLLSIKSLEYHLTNEEGKIGKDHVPMISLKGNIDLSNAREPIKDLGITLTQPMQSAFLNLLIHENLFRGGTFTGNMHLINTGKYPVLKGDLKAHEVGIPSQRLFIKNGEIKSNGNLLDITSNGYYRRSEYDVNASIDNKIVFPIVVKKSGLILDNIDVEKYMQALNEHSSSGQASDNVQEVIAKSNKSESFDLANIVVEDCVINIKNGHYKNINFSDVVGNLTLDKNSILVLKSNRFNVAEGMAEANSTNDLKNHKYNLKLAVIGVNSDLVASELVNLPKEINGKASGIIDLNTDETLRLNGTISFIIQNGIIAKIGLVEYTMKVASIFRNPIVMITPTVISDLIDVPEGKFDRINGELTLENNVIRRLIIKSVSPQLSTFIVGRYNLHNQDAILRIYTKFSNKRKGAFGFLRSISLNNLANRIPLNTKNNSNYYEAEIKELPRIEAEDKDTQIFLTTVDGDIVTNNFISALKKIK